MSNETKTDVLEGALLWALTLAYEDRERAEHGHDEQVRKLTARVDVLRAEADALRAERDRTASQRDYLREELDRASDGASAERVHYLNQLEERRVEIEALQDTLKAAIANAESECNATVSLIAERDAVCADRDQARLALADALRSNTLVNRVVRLARDLGWNGVAPSESLEQFLVAEFRKLSEEGYQLRAQLDALKASLSIQEKLHLQVTIGDLTAERDQLRAELAALKAAPKEWVKIGDLHHAHPDGRFVGWFEVQGRTMTIDGGRSKWHDAEPVEAARDRGWHDFPGVTAPQPECTSPTYSHATLTGCANLSRSPSADLAEGLVRELDEEAEP